MWVKGEIFRNLDEVSASARGELDRAAQISLFDRLEWFRRTYYHTGPVGTPMIVRARADGSDCWLFLMERGRKGTALTSWYSLSFRPVFTNGPDEATKFALLLAAARRLRSRLHRITLGPMAGAEARLVTRAFDRARWVATTRETTVNWTVSTEDLTFADYWAGRPGELRSTVKRKAGKFAIDTQVYDNFDGAAWADYETIYAASWKPEEGSRAFVRDMALTEGAAGCLRLGIARIEGSPVAAQLWTVENGRAIIHKLAHLEAAREQSPGTVLTATMFEHVIDRDRVAVVDFGTGDDAYKADWMDQRTPLMTVDLYNPMSAAGLMGTARAAASALVGPRPPR